MRGANPWKRVLWPAALTLAVTILRLTGELRDWSPTLFVYIGAFLGDSALGRPVR